MGRYTLQFDRDLCIGCQICEGACKQENNLSVGPRWIRAIEVRPKEVGRKLAMSFSNIRCMHCGKPPCIDVCPTKAISKRIDGIVLINSDLCNGCMACIEACPFGAPQFNSEVNIVEKCTLCVHRVEKGLRPACVQYCPTGALQSGDIYKLSEVTRTNRVRRTNTPK